jgi:hypothetical protein
MIRRLGLGLVLLGMLGCGSDSMLPLAVHDSMKVVEVSLEQQDSEASCTALMGLTGELYEWQSFARGNQPMLVQELLMGLEYVTSGCQGVSLGEGGQAEGIDLDTLRQRYEHWADETAKSTTRESSAGKWFAYLFGSLVIGGILMYWRRKFREA